MNNKLLHVEHIELLGGLHQTQQQYLASLGNIHLVALLAFLPGNFSWGAVGVTLILYWITGGLGITLGFHRLVSHRSFRYYLLLYNRKFPSRFAVKFGVTRH